MVFSIFKKKDQEPAKPVPHQAASKGQQTSAPAAAPLPAPSTITSLMGSIELSIEVGNGSDVLSPGEEQAAMAYASGQDKDAEQTLIQEVAAIKGQRRLETWLMLFELYQQTGKQAAFEELGLSFVSEFEKTPPIWRKFKTQAKEPAAQSAGNFCTFSAKLTDSSIARDLANYVSALSKGSSIRLDFSKVTEIDSLAAAELLSAWQHNRKPGNIPQVQGWQSFTRLLSGKIATGRREPSEAPLWLLLTEVYQALGQQEEFENLAIDYAITYEVSPPSWDIRYAPKVAVRTPEKVVEPVKAPSGSGEGFLVPGSLTGQNTAALNALRDQAKSGSGELLLDFSIVDRLDFETAGLMLNLCMGLLQEGRSIHIIQINELVLSMLRIMSVNDLAQLERRKA